MSEQMLHIPGDIQGIVRQPNWYEHLNRIRGGLMLGTLATQPTIDAVEVKTQVSHVMLRIFTQLLAEGAVSVGEAGPNWDAERQAIDTIIVHHTASQKPMDLRRLNAMHLLNLYVPKYRHPGPDIGLIGGTPIYSGHANKTGSQVFYGYHWLIRADGSSERLLDDAAIGWHSGDWGTNIRSVAICFDGDFETGRPSQAALDAAAGLIARQYEQVASARILGHRAIVPTICPGNEFDIWGEELRALVDASRAIS